MKHRALSEIFNAALAAVDPYRAVAESLRCDGRTLFAGGAAYDLAAFGRILVIGAGKATARMAEAAESVLGDRIADGLIIVKYGHTSAALRWVAQVEAGHPVPDSAGVEGTNRLLGLVGSSDERTLVLCLLSGGGSALLVAPLPGLTLEDKQRTTDLLLRSGASIDELNAVRKHLSAVKGGRLAQQADSATVLTLILSDVIGDRLDVIASGPTAPDGSTFADAARVIEKYGLPAQLPPRVAAFIGRGAAGQEPETVKSGAVCFERTRNVIVGGIGRALAAAREQADAAGYAAEIATAELRGEARDAGRRLARAAITLQDALREGERRCLLFGGETTVTVRGKGRGGRNQELALKFAIEIAGIPGIMLLSAGTDGTDGPTDAAGAAVDGATVRNARLAGLHPETYLEDNDAYTFFDLFDAATGGHAHLKTGPTGTNVMDIQIILVEGRPAAVQRNGAPGIM